MKIEPVLKFERKKNIGTRILRKWRMIRFRMGFSIGWDCVRQGRQWHECLTQVIRAQKVYVICGRYSGVPSLKSDFIRSGLFIRMDGKAERNVSERSSIAIIFVTVWALMVSSFVAAHPIESVELIMSPRRGL